MDGVCFCVDLLRFCSFFYLFFSTFIGGLTVVYYCCGFVVYIYIVWIPGCLGVLYIIILHALMTRSAIRQ